MGGGVFVVHMWVLKFGPTSPPLLSLPLPPPIPSISQNENIATTNTNARFKLQAWLRQRISDALLAAGTHAAHVRARLRAELPRQRGDDGCEGGQLRRAGHAARPRCLPGGRPGGRRRSQQLARCVLPAAAAAAQQQRQRTSGGGSRTHSSACQRATCLLPACALIVAPKVSQVTWYTLQPRPGVLARQDTLLQMQQQLFIGPLLAAAKALPAGSLRASSWGVAAACWADGVRQRWQALAGSERGQQQALLAAVGVSALLCAAVAAAYAAPRR